LAFLRLPREKDALNSALFKSRNTRLSWEERIGNVKNIVFETFIMAHCIWEGGRGSFPEG